MNKTVSPGFVDMVTLIMVGALVMLKCNGSKTSWAGTAAVLKARAASDFFEKPHRYRD